MLQAPFDIKNPLSNAKIIGGNVPYSVYHAQEAKRGDKNFIMSRGELCEFDRCPARWLAGYESDETKSTEWGDLLDCLVLSPEAFEGRFAVTPETYPDTKTGEPKDWNWNANFCKEWRKSLGGKLAVKSEIKAEADEARNVLLSDSRIAELIKCSKKQVMVMAEYHDKETGLVIPIKTLIDMVPDVGSSYGQYLADFKTCASAVPGAWARVVFDRGYYTQASLYQDSYVAATGEDRNSFLHVLQENYAPWQVGRRLLSAEFLEIGRMHYLAALKRYARCLAEGKFPGYDDEAALNGWTLTEILPWMIGK